MFSTHAFSIITRRAAAITLSIATAAAVLVQPALVANAATPTLATQGLPMTAGSLGETVHAGTKTNVVVMFQKVESFVNGSQWTYSVANASDVPAQSVVITKDFKIVQTGVPTALAAPPQTQNLGTLAPYEVRWITFSCGNNTPQKQCVGTSLSAKTTTPEVLLNDNSASHSYQ